MKTNDLSDIRARLWDSAEMGYVRTQLIVWLVCLGLSLICSGVGENWRLTFPAMAVVISIVFLPILGFWLWRVIRIFSHLDGYVFCRTELSQPHHAPLSKGLFSFMGVIETERDGRFAVETHAIFQSAGFGLLMEDYIGRTVTVAWNRETDMVVVIG